MGVEYRIINAADNLKQDQSENSDDKTNNHVFILPKNRLNGDFLLPNEASKIQKFHFGQKWGGPKII